MRQKSVVSVVLLFAALGASCSRDPETLKREYVASGDRYLAAKKFSEASIEYRNAVGQDGRFAEARVKLAGALESMGDGNGALREYVRAADLLPQDTSVQLRAGQLLLRAKQFPEARTRAEAALKQDPKNLDALVLLGNALAGLKDFEGAISHLEQAIEGDPRQTLAYTNLGAVQLEKGDAQAAERIFRRAVEVQPDSAEAHVALANYLWASGRFLDAETQFKAALAIEPKSTIVLTALAALYVGSGRSGEAEPYLKTYVEVLPYPVQKLTLADFYLLRGEPRKAVEILEPLAGEKDGFIPATLRLAGIDYSEKNRERAYQRVDSVLQRESKNELALLMKGRFLVTDGKPREGLAIGDAVIAANPKSVWGRYLRGRALELTGSSAEAISAFQELLTLDPSNVQALTRLGVLQVARGDAAAAAEVAARIIKIQPLSGDAHLLMAKAALGQGNLALAESELAGLMRGNPNLAEVHTLLGSLYTQRGETARARASFEQALKLDPDSQDAFYGLVRADLVAKRPDAARARMEARLERAPNDPGVLLIAGRVFAEINDTGKAEAAFRKAIEIDPSNLAAYTLLGRLLLTQQRLGEALKEYEELAVRHPEAAVGAHTMAGIILGLQNRPGEARRRYEQALAVDPRAAVAANNLAWYYANNDGNLDTALHLAETAKSQLPESAEVSDTLGWIYYKKSLATLAITALLDGVMQDQSNPIIHYHLGLAYAKNGDSMDAQRSLQKALQLDPKFAGADEARRVLGSLKS